MAIRPKNADRRHMRQRAQPLQFLDQPQQLVVAPASRRRALRFVSAQRERSIDAGGLPRAFAQIPVVGLANPFAQRNPRLPAEAVSFELSSSLRGVPSGLRRIEDERAAESDDLADQLREFADRHIFAEADVHDLRRVVVFEQKAARAGEIVHVQKFAPRRARAPDHHLARARSASPRGLCAAAPAARASWSGRSCRPDRKDSSASR